MHVSEQLAGPPQSGLDFVQHHQDPFTVAQFTDLFQISRRRHLDPAFSLDRLQHHGAHLGTEGLLQGTYIAIFHNRKTVRNRIKALPELILAGGRHRSQGAAMEGTLDRNDLRAAFALLTAVLAGQLDGALIGFGPRIAEKDLRFKRICRRFLYFR